MKMNKLAAGALALALGLGAVAPAVAAESKNGTKLVEVNYNEKLEEAQKYFGQREDARKKLAAAKERYEAAKKAEKAANEKWKNLPADPADADANRDSKVIQGEIDAQKKVVAPLVQALETAMKADPRVQSDIDTAKANLKPAMDKLDALKTELGEKLREEKENAPKVNQNKLAPKAQALVDLAKAQEETRVAYAAYGDAIDNEIAISKKFADTMKELDTAAQLVNKIVTIEGSKIVVKPSETKKDNVAELKRAKADAETAIKAVKLLKELSPEKIKKVEAKLNALVAKNEELVKKADAKIAELEKKMAFISTAYAAEDDTDALIKELDQTTGEIKELIKDTPEDKKENEEKKPEEKKPENKPAKQSGKNAKTGIAGLAGVAGILAAASVAYAASKRD